MLFKTSTKRNHSPTRHVATYNIYNFNIALAGRTPLQKLGLLQAAE